MTRYSSWTHIGRCGAIAPSESRSKEPSKTVSEEYGTGLAHVMLCKVPFIDSPIMRRNPSSYFQCLVRFRLYFHSPTTASPSNIQLRCSFNSVYSYLLTTNSNTGISDAHISVVCPGANLRFCSPFNRAASLIKAVCWPYTFFIPNIVQRQLASS